MRISRIFKGWKRQRLPESAGPLKISQGVRFVFPDRIRLGRHIRISQDCYLNGQGGIQIGDGTILGPEVVILSSTHRYKQDKYLPYDEYDEFKPVSIGRGVWIGYRAMIVPGVKIGDGAIVAMGAVVVKDVESGAIVGGNPARIIGQRDRDWIADTIQAERYYIRAVVEDGVRRNKTTPPPPEPGLK